MKSIFINKNINVYNNQEADRLLLSTNDRQYLNNGEIISVSKERWEEAQYYENKTWMKNGINNDDDRNYEHSERFNNYESVRFENIKSYIELGCGPFTNTRVLIDRLPDDCSIHLLDPLIHNYINHPNCFYKNQKYKNKKLETISSSIELFETNMKYDCVLINNVLEHCFDIPSIFNKILSLLKPKAILIFSDVCFLKENIQILSEKTYDAGHPIRISKDTIDLFLNNFEPIFTKDFYGLYEQSWRIDKYFIGTKI